MILYSRRGFAALLQEREAVEQLLAEKTREMGDAARSDPDLPENTEFKTLKAEIQFNIPERLRKIGDKIVEARIIEDSDEFLNADFKTVVPGSRVRFSLFGEVIEYLIAGSGEIDEEEGILAYDTPLAAALLGMKEDEESVFKAPSGKELPIKILRITKGL